VTIKKVLFIFLTALIVRIGYAWFFIEAEYLILEDQKMYIQLGKVMAETSNFLLDPSGYYAVVTDRLHGYPTLLAVVYTLFGENNLAVVMIQIFIDSLTCVIIGLIAESIITRGFIVAGIVSALNLNMIILSGMILTDTLFLFIFSLFILLVISYIKHPTNLKLFTVISVLSLSALVRPVSYYLIFLILPLLIGFFVWKGVSFKRVMYSLLLYIIPVVIVFGSIHHRNYHEYNSFSLVSQGGGHVLGWIVPATYQYSGQGSYQEGQVLAKGSLENAMHRDEFKMSPNNPFKNSAYKMQVAKEVLTELGLLNMLHAWSAGAVINLLTPSIAHAPIVRAMEHPSFYATSGDGMVEKFLNYVTNTDSLLYLSIITIGTIVELVFIIASTFGLYRMIQSSWFEGYNRETLLFLLFVIVYFIAITGPIVGVKYRLPIEPILTVFFSYALLRYRKKS
jgi:hypothetical protein